MKKSCILLLTFLNVTLFVSIVNAQSDLIVKTRKAALDSVGFTETKKLVDQLFVDATPDPLVLFSYFKDNLTRIKFTDKYKRPDKAFATEFAAIINDVDASDKTIILCYNPFFIDSSKRYTNDNKLVRSVILSRNKNGDRSWTNYLLGRKKVVIIEINSKSPMFDKSIVNVQLKKSLTEQSFSDLVSFVYPADGGNTDEDFINAVTFNVKILDSSQIKAPSIISDSIVGIPKTSVALHDLNVVNFQVGIASTDYKLNNFSISGGQLIVTPDTTQKKGWKSNLFAIVEVHLPRDIDNFQPIWKTAFGKNQNKGKSQQGFMRSRFYNLTLDRIGIYGGVKISGDPLSNLYAGLNYAITKDLYFTIGYSWTNTVNPQVTDIKNVSSLDDAVKYFAKRSYSKPQFSWGLSFSPSAIASIFSQKGK